MFAAALTIVAIIISVLVFFLVGSKELMPYLLLPLALFGALTYIFKQQINSWWDQKFPPKMDEHTRQLLIRYFPYYRKLNEDDKLKFETRVELFRLEKQYFSQEFEEFPYDIKVLIISNAIQVTFGFPEFLLDHWSTIVIYRGPFHSPQIKEFHTGELHYEDGVVLLAVDPMLEGMLKPDVGYNMAIHQFAKAYQHERCIKNEDFIFILGTQDEIVNIYLERLSEVRGRAFRFEKFYGNYDASDLFGVSVEHLFVAPEKFKQIMPDSFVALKRILNQDVMNPETPVVNIVI